MKSMKEMALEFSHAFGRPVNDSVVPLTVTERELLGKLIFEECLEYVTKGLGLELYIRDGYWCESVELTDSKLTKGEVKWELSLNEGQRYDPIESADGLGDMNVVIHFNSLWHGFDIDAITYEIFLSNMSKLDEMGNPIINVCSECLNQTCADPYKSGLIDPTKPLGKILKGPNFFKPDIARVIGLNTSKEK